MNNKGIKIPWWEPQIGEVEYNLVKKALEAFIFLHVDLDEFPKAGEEYAVDAMPTMVVLDTEGRELHRFVGLMEPEELARRLGEIAGRTADE